MSLFICQFTHCPVVSRPAALVPTESELPQRRPLPSHLIPSVPSHHPSPPQSASSRLVSTRGAIAIFNCVFFWHPSLLHLPKRKIQSLFPIFSLPLSLFLSLPLPFPFPFRYNAARSPHPPPCRSLFFSLICGAKIPNTYFFWPPAATRLEPAAYLPDRFSCILLDYLTPAFGFSAAPWDSQPSHSFSLLLFFGSGNGKA
ncbi:hypothetical protein B0J13DRAFT_138459 [Dactylonectria estremocensis]|uniref:Uncharacterized protein n=1 Tax=Dactylonectria estremocensis TaxID=1079267 RepID=A0A9P9E3U4_9HYPO|nr:hypothetical protein B0J13DRAFT_138459 [Dactylonectria estremocensis]